MQKRMLGKTGLEVTELCFGALPMGPLQKDLPVEECAKVVAHALRSGINFVDTAQMYRTYEPIRLAMEETGIRPILASKSNKRSYEGMREAVEEALAALRIDQIEIFLLHAARDGKETFTLYEGALRCLEEMKAAGKIKAIGISTHHPAVAALAAAMPNIDVVFPIINKDGRGIIEGTREEMLAAIDKCVRAGKGVYLMKVLSGGSLIGDYSAALKFARSIEGYAAVAIGMVSTREVDFNVAYFNGTGSDVIPAEVQEVKAVKVFSSLCKSCGACMNACPNKAIAYDANHKAWIDPEKCLTCGYCTPACPEFAIRWI